MAIRRPTARPGILQSNGYKPYSASKDAKFCGNCVFVKLKNVGIMTVQSNWEEGRTESEEERESFPATPICFCFHYAKRQPISANNIVDLFIRRRASGAEGPQMGSGEKKGKQKWEKAD